jgi:hypothetical protein
LIHALPHGFLRIRHYGLLASGARADNIAQARRLFDVPAAQPEAGDDSRAETTEPKLLSHPSPCCGGRMIHRSMSDGTTSCLGIRPSHMMRR